MNCRVMFLLIGTVVDANYGKYHVYIFLHDALFISETTCMKSYTAQGVVVMSII